MVPFDWADPFRLEDQLTDEERMIRDAAHGFAQDVLQPRVIAAFRDEIDAPELFGLMGEAGLLGVTIPESFGGSGSQAAPYRRDRSRISTQGEPHPGSSPRPVQVSTGRSGRRRKSKALRASRTRRDQPRLTGGHITYMVRSVKDKGGKLGFERLDLSPKGFLLVE